MGDDIKKKQLRILTKSIYDLQKLVFKQAIGLPSTSVPSSAEPGEELTEAKATRLFPRSKMSTNGSPMGLRI